MKMKLMPKQEIKAGEVGYIISGIKSAVDVKVGDTLTNFENPCLTSIAGFEDVKPMVFAGVYPIDSEDFEDLRSSLEKLQLKIIFIKHKDLL